MKALYYDLLKGYKGIKLGEFTRKILAGMEKYLCSISISYFIEIADEVDCLVAEFILSEAKGASQ